MSKQQLIKWLKWSLITLGTGFVLFNLIGFWGLPGAIQYFVIPQLSQTLNRTVTLEEIDFHPYQLTLNLQKFTITSPDSQETFVSFRQFQVDLAWRSLKEWAIIIESVTLDDPFIHVVHFGDNHFNFSDLMASTEDNKSEPEDTATVPLFELNQLSIQQGSLQFDDQSRPQTHRIENLEFRLPFLSNLEDRLTIKALPTLSATFNQMPFDIRGASTPFAPSQETQMAISFRGLDITEYLRYLPEEWVQVRSGLIGLDTQISYVLDEQEQPHLDISSSLQVDRLEVADAQDLRFGNFPTIRLATSISQQGSEPWHFQVDLEIAQMELKDQSIGISANLPTFRVSTEASYQTPLQVEVNTTLQSKKISVSDQIRNLQINLPQLELSTQASYQDPAQTSVKSTLQLRDLEIIDKGRSVQGHIPEIQLKATATQSNNTSLALDGELQLTQIAVGLIEQSPFAQIAKIGIQMAPSYILESQFHIAEIQLQQPELKLHRTNDGSLDLVTLFTMAPDTSLPPPPDLPPVPSPSTEASDLSLRLDQFSMVDGTVEFTDHSVPPDFGTTLSNITLHLNNFHTDPSQQADFQLAVSTEIQEGFQVSGMLGLDPLHVTGKATLQQISLPKYAPYYQDLIQFKLAQGQLDVETQYNFENQSQSPQIAITGLALHVHKLQLQTPAQQSFFDLPEFAIQDASFDWLQRQIVIPSIYSQQGVLQTQRFQDGSINLAKLFTPRTAPSNKEPLATEPSNTKSQASPARASSAHDSTSSGSDAPVIGDLELGHSTNVSELATRSEQMDDHVPEPEWQVHVGQVHLEKYQIQFEDFAALSPFQTTLENMELRISNFRLAPNHETLLQLSTQTESDEMLRWEGRAQLDPLRVHGTVGVTALRLEKYAPYYADQLLYELEGRLQLEGAYELDLHQDPLQLRIPSLDATLQQVRLEDPQTQEDPIQIDSLTVQGASLDLLKQKIHLPQIKSNNGRLLLRRQKDGQINLQSIVPTKNESSTSNEMASTPEPATVSSQEASNENEEAPSWQLALDNFELNNYEVVWEDQVPSDPFTTSIQKIQLQVSDFQYPPDHATRIQFTAETIDQEQFAISNQLTLEPLTAQGTLNIQALVLEKYAPYYSEFLQYSLGGHLEMQTEYRFANIEESWELQLVHLNTALQDLRLRDPIAQEDVIHLPYFGLEEARLDLQNKELIIPRIQTSQGSILLRRFPDGRFNLQNIAKTNETTANSTQPTSAPAGNLSNNISSTESSQAEEPWNITLSELDLAEYQIRFEDQSLTTPFETTLQNIQLEVSDFQNKDNHLTRASLFLETESQERFQWNGTLGLTPLSSTGAVHLEQLVLEKYAPYYSNVLVPEMTGTLEAQTHYTVAVNSDTSGPQPESPNGLQLKIFQLSTTLHDFRLTDTATKEAPVRIPLLAITDANLDLGQNTLSIPRFATQEGTIVVRRFKDGQFNLQKFIKTAPPNPPASSNTAHSQSSKTGSELNTATSSQIDPPTQDDSIQNATPWKIQLGETQITDYAMLFEDRSASPVTTALVTQMFLGMHDFSNAPGHQSQAELSFNLNSSGAVDIEGSLGLDPLFANLDVGLHRINVAAFHPYIPKNIKILVTRGELSAEGNVLLQAPSSSAEPEAASGGLQVHYRGNTALANLNTLHTDTGAELFRWGDFQLNNLDFQNDPLQLHIGDVMLNDFYVPITVDSQGVVNLTGLVEAEKEAETLVEAETAGQPTLETQQTEDIPRKKTQQTEDIPRKKTQQTEDIPQKEAYKIEQEPAASPSFMEALNIGQIRLEKGHFHLLDQQVRPAFSLSLTDFGGTISQIAPSVAEPAQIQLGGRLDDDSNLEVQGNIQPFQNALSLNLNIQSQGLEMTPLSPYVGKYLGYSIAKGKLSLDLKYLVDQNKLIASNKVQLDQFTLGETVESEEALPLPFGFLISLLTDRDGKIHLDVPMEGNLEDPQFSFAETALQAIVTILQKVATAPFDLLGELFGEGEKLEYLDFQAGQAQITEEHASKLQILAQALEQRPSLKLDLEGYIDSKLDPPVLTRQTLEQQLRLAKLKTRLAKGLPAIPLEEISLASSEYRLHLKELYQEQFPPVVATTNTPTAPSLKEPEATIAVSPPAVPPPTTPSLKEPEATIAVSPPAPPTPSVEVMEKELLSTIVIKSEELRELARQRALAVKNYLVEQGISAERLFLKQTDPLTPPSDTGAKPSHVALRLN